MKRIKLIFISSFFTLFLFTSCEDSYNIVQDGELNESAITDLTSLRSYLNGVYTGTYGTAGVTISDQIGFTGIFTDECGVGRGNGGQSLNLHRFFLTTGEGYASSIWYGNYQVINRCNRTIRMANDQVTVPTDPTDLAEYNSILAEARALRAFSYFQLLTYFSTDLKDDNALGVMFFTNVPQASDQLPRVANGIIFNQIEEDLEFAFNNVVASAVTPYKYIRKPMISALRARMYLYRGNYTLAKQYAEEAIATSGVTLTPATPIVATAPTNPNYSVFVAANPASAGSPTAAWNTAFYGTASTNPYRRMWADAATGGQGEIIWSLDRPAAQTWENIATQFTTNSSNLAGSPLFEVGRSLFNKLKATPGDVRRYVNVDPTSLINQNYATDPNYIATDVLVIDKYPGKTGFVTRNDIKVFRLSEMYLILAECYANQGNFNGGSNSVASVIKQIKDARSFLGAQALPSYADATAAWAGILNERRLELCFEGHRYIDLKRLANLAGQTMDRDATDDQISGAELSIPNNDYRYTLPIPLDEIIANPNIQQNPGYTD